MLVDGAVVLLVLHPEVAHRQAHLGGHVRRADGVVADGKDENSDKGVVLVELRPGRRAVVDDPDAVDLEALPPPGDAAASLLGLVPPAPDAKRGRGRLLLRELDGGVDELVVRLRRKPGGQIFLRSPCRISSLDPAEGRPQHRDTKLVCLSSPNRSSHSGISLPTSGIHWHLAFDLRLVKI